MTTVPGETPTLPVMTEDPVLVTVEPPSTAKFCAVPRLWARAGEVLTRVASAITERRRMYFGVAVDRRCIFMR